MEKWHCVPEKTLRGARGAGRTRFYLTGVYQGLDVEQSQLVVIGPPDGGA